MQRLHEDDLTGYILSHKNNIRHISLQLIAESDQKIVMPISKTVINLKRGDLLDKNRFNMDIVNDLKRNMGSYNFSGQYQQSPVPASGGIIKREWVKFYNPRIKKDFEVHIHSWDFAFKANDDNDFVAGQDWGKDNANIYLCDFIKERLTFNQSLQEMAKFTKKNSNYSEILIEDKANGTAIHDTIKEHIMGVIPIEPEGSKEARVHAVSPLWEAGNVYLPCDSDQQTIDRYNQSPTKENYARLSISPEVEDFIKSMATFPKGKHDDDVDAMSQALFRIKSTTSFDNMVNSVYNLGRYRVQDYS
jgi:predicted phage terminase large subunit-like protein